VHPVDAANPETTNGTVEPGPLYVDIEYLSHELYGLCDNIRFEHLFTLNYMNGLYENFSITRLETTSSWKRDVSSVAI
jgi:hypothetical protein